MSRISQFSLEPDDRQVREGLVCQRKANGLVVRRANALLFPDDQSFIEAIATRHQEMKKAPVS